MKLLSLRMKNFRQHSDSTITFRSGLTGIIGPNGAGKSTILEGIAWAMYGASAARGTNDTIRFSRAGARARVEVELAFSLGGHEYRVLRTLHGAEVFLDGGPTAVASGVGGVSGYLQSRVGMSRDEFFNTYFTGQKELQFLAAMGPADRGRFLSQVLGYERLRRAQELVRNRRSELRSEIRGLRASLGDRDELVGLLTAASTRVTEAVDRLSAARKEAEEAAAAEKAFAPRWEKAEKDRERFRELSHVIEAAERDRDGAKRELERASAELQVVDAAEKELAPLRTQLGELPAATEACERFTVLARQEEGRKALARQLADLDAELTRARERREKLESAPELEKKYSAELEALRAQRDTVAGTLDEKKSAWLADKQDAFTKLTGYRDRASELKGQIAEIERLGPEGTCPTCGRPVGKDYERLLEELRDQWTLLVQDGKWWAKRHEQLEPRPEDLVELETLLPQLNEAVDDRARKLTRCQSALQELEQLSTDLAARTARGEELRAELAALPGGYDAKAHRAADDRLKALREVEKRAARLEEAVTRRAAAALDEKQAREREAAALAVVRKAGKERTALDFSEETFAALRVEHDRLAEARRAAELRAAEARGDANTAEQVLRSARDAVTQYDERAKTIAEQEADLHYHEELDAAYTDLRQELNDQVRPELSEIASAFLAQLTDGRYTSMEIDESYNLMVLDEGEEKPVISGGEEDVANLVLRLSLSQMIAERAGHPLSLLILDEVFGSLDVARRDNVVQLLHHLEDRFEQVILITHIDGIRESLDQVLRVEYDERAGCSHVREESVHGDEYPEAPMAAD
ncbi:MAG TPA: SMC family ATPase [Longimicrobium sp.]|jgi:exonuclease SbcC|uniref:SMC family ATPase n=1 Tax=Longimicrobium sp. TaxID=2029185 RepID=UPI002ED9B696